MWYQILLFLCEAVKYFYNSLNIFIQYCRLFHMMWSVVNYYSI